MPQVPVYGAPKVQERPLPDLAQPVQAPIEAFGGGAGLEAQARARERVTDVFSGIAIREQEKIDQLNVTDADNRLETERARIMQDPKKGALRQRGSLDDVARIPDEAFGDFDKSTSSIESGLTNDRQKIAFRARSMQVRQGMNRQIQEHMSREFTRIDTSITTTKLDALQGAVREAAARGDRDALYKAIEDQGDEVLKFGSRNEGIPREVLLDMARKTVSKSRLAALEAMVDAKDYDGAKALYKELLETGGKNAFVPEDGEHAKKLITGGSALSEGQRASFQVTAEYGNERAAKRALQQMAEAGTLSPEALEIAERRTSQAFSDMAQEDQAARQAAFRAALNAVEMQAKDPRHKDPSDILGAAWFNMDPSERNALRSAFDHSRSGTEPVQDDAVYGRFFSMSREEQAKISEGELFKEYRPRLNNASWSKVFDRWTSARDFVAGKKLDAKAAEDASLDDYVKQIFRTTAAPGKDPGKYTGKDETAYARFQLLVDAEVRMAREASGKPLDRDVMRTIVEEIAVRTLNDKRVIYMDEGEIRNAGERFESATGFKKIPEDHLEKLLAVAKGKGNPIYTIRGDSEAAKSNRRILGQAYSAYLSGDYALMRKILSGDPELIESANERSLYPAGGL